MAAAKSTGALTSMSDSVLFRKVTTNLGPFGLELNPFGCNIFDCLGSGFHCCRKTGHPCQQVHFAIWLLSQRLTKVAWNEHAETITGQFAVTNEISIDLIKSYSTPLVNKQTNSAHVTEFGLNIRHTSIKIWSSDLSTLCSGVLGCHCSLTSVRRLLMWLYPLSLTVKP